MDRLDELMHRKFRPENIRTIKCKSYGCRGEVVLDNGWANECLKCGTEYNGSGQMLAPREQWGWETGERF